MCRLIEADSDSESDDEDGDEDDFMGAHGACEDPGCGHEHHHAEVRPTRQYSAMHVMKVWHVMEV